MFEYTKHGAWFNTDRGVAKHFVMKVSTTRVDVRNGISINASSEQTADTRLQAKAINAVANAQRCETSGCRENGG